MNANLKEQQVLEEAGYSFEYPGFWLKACDGFNLTIADGMSCNNLAWEVQAEATRQDVEGLSESSDQGFESVQDAILYASQTYERVADDNERSNGQTPR